MTRDKFVLIVVKRKLTGVIDFDPVSIDGDLVRFRIIKIPMAEGINNGFLHSTNGNLRDLDPCAAGKISAPVDMFFGVNFAPLDQTKKRAAKTLNIDERHFIFSGKDSRLDFDTAVFAEERPSRVEQFFAFDQVNLIKDIAPSIISIFNASGFAAFLNKLLNGRNANLGQ